MKRSPLCHTLSKADSMSNNVAKVFFFSANACWTFLLRNRRLFLIFRKFLIPDWDLMSKSFFTMWNSSRNSMTLLKRRAMQGIMLIDLSSVPFLWIIVTIEFFKKEGFLFCSIHLLKRTRTHSFSDLANVLEYFVWDSMLVSRCFVVNIFETSF